MLIEHHDGMTQSNARRQSRMLPRRHGRVPRTHSRASRFSTHQNCASHPRAVPIAIWASSRCPARQAAYRYRYRTAPSPTRAAREAKVCASTAVSASARFRGVGIRPKLPSGTAAAAAATSASSGRTDDRRRHEHPQGGRRSRSPAPRREPGARSRTGRAGPTSR